MGMKEEAMKHRGVTDTVMVPSLPYQLSVETVYRGCYTAHGLLLPAGCWTATG